MYVWITQPQRRCWMAIRAREQTRANTSNDGWPASRPLETKMHIPAATLGMLLFVVSRERTDCLRIFHPIHRSGRFFQTTTGLRSTSLRPIVVWPTKSVFGRCSLYHTLLACQQIIWLLLWLPNNCYFCTKSNFTRTILLFIFIFEEKLPRLLLFFVLARAALHTHTNYSHNYSRVLFACISNKYKNFSERAQFKFRLILMISQ